MVVTKIRSVIRNCLFSVVVQGIACTAAIAASNNLTPEQISVIKQLNENFSSYRSVALAGDVAGRPRTIVLMGEIHVKSKGDAKLGESALNAFRAYGLEGADVSKTWGGHALLYAVRAMMASYKLLSFGRLNQDSTIYLARDRGLAHLEIARLYDQLQGLDLEHMSPEDLNRVTVMVDGRQKTGAEVMANLRQLQEQAQSEPNVIWLERGHVPKIGENITSVALPAFVAYGSYVVGRALNQFGRSFLTAYYFGAITTTALFALPNMAILATLYYFPDGTLAKIIGLPLQALLTGRNENMAENVIKSFEGDPELNTMLVIVGRDHVKGMRQLFEHNHGFRKLSLDPH